MTRRRWRLLVVVVGSAAVAAALAFARPILRWVRRAVPPPRPAHEVRLVEGVWIPMRDGVRLATDLYFPAGAKEPLPAILLRTPYDRTRDRRDGSEARIFAGQGYVVAVQDVRGRHASEGAFRISSKLEATDGYDTLSWLAAQRWSSGRIGTYGCSYLGEVQYMLAALRHPNHTAAIAQSGAAWGGDSVRLFGFSRGGVLELATAFGWFRERGSKVFPVPPVPPVDYQQALRHLPPVEIMRESKGPPTDFEAFASHPPADPYWEYLGPITGAEQFDVPTLHVNSWYDVTPSSTLSLFALLKARSVSARARDNQYLIMSPATHCDSERLTWLEAVGRRRLGDPRFDYFGHYLRFFERWLKDVDNGLEREPRVHAFAMGANEWRALPTWPPEGMQPERWYLRSGGRANTRGGDGRLAREAPGEEPFDAYVYDPMDPAPSRGITCCVSGLDFEPGGHDQSDIEDREDVLVYSTDALAEDLEVSGPVVLQLWVASSAVDTDFTAKLVDVYPDGRAFNLQEGILRARYREGFDREVFLAPDAVVPVTIEIESTSNVFEAGHRLRLEVSSSNFPRWERNLNTGGRNFDEVRGVAAKNQVHHSAAYPSHLVLPVVRPVGAR